MYPRDSIGVDCSMFTDPSLARAKVPWERRFYLWSKFRRYRVPGQYHRQHPPFAFMFCFCSSQRHHHHTKRTISSASDTCRSILDYPDIAQHMMASCSHFANPRLLVECGHVTRTDLRPYSTSICRDATHKSNSYRPDK